MADEKIICCGDPYRGNNDALAYALAGRNNNDALMGALLGQRDNGAEMAAMMNGGMGNWMNNPFAYMMMLGMFRFMYGDNWNNNNGDVQRAEIQSQIDSLRTQMQDGNNTNLLMGAIQGNNSDLKALAASLNCDFNALQSSVCSIQAALQQVGGQVGFSAERVINAVNLGDMNIIQQFKDCCCQTQQNIIRMGYENQLGQKDIENRMQTGFDFVNRSIERGFSAVGYQMGQDKCDIIQAGNANTQRIIDTLNCHWNQDLQQRYNDARLELSQLRQNETLIAALRTTGSTTQTT